MKSIHPTDKHVGARLRMRRIMLKKTQSEVAKGLGVTFQQLQKYENGTNRISASRLQTVCGILRVSAAFLFEGAPQAEGLPAFGEEEPTPSYVNEFLATSDGVALAMAFQRIHSPRLRRAIVALVEQIVFEPGERVSGAAEVEAHE